MRLDFNRVEIHNFLSFDDEVFEFGKHHGMNLICGVNKDIPGAKNGCGKSSVCMALIYGLFGQLPNKVKAENIANRYVAEKDVRVVVYLNVNDIGYKAVTGLNKRAQSYFNLYEIKDGVENDITKSSIAETREYFETEILHCDISMFLRIIFLTSEQNYNFFKLKLAAKKEFIEKLFDIGVFGEMYDVIHKDTLRYDKDIVSQQNQLIVLNKSQTDYEDRIKAFDENKKANVARLEDKLEKCSAELAEKTNATVSKNEALVAKCEEAIKKIKDLRKKTSDALDKINQDIRKNDVSSSKNNNAIKSRQEVINKHKVILDKLCSDCRVIFSEHYNLTTYANEIKQLNESNAKILDLVGKLDEDRKTTLKKLQDLDAKENEVNKKINQLTEAYEKAQRELRQYENLVNNTKFELDNAKSSENPYVDLLEKNKKNVDEISNRLEKTTKAYKCLKFAESIVSQDTLRKFIIRDLIVLINNRIKHYLSRLGSNYTCTFDENLDYEFITDSGTCEYENFSCGEKNRLSVAASLAFRDFVAQRSNITSNILVIDEYFDGGVDGMCIEAMMEILKEYVKTYDQNVFIISHRAEVNSDVFDNIIVVEKENNISKIKYSNS